MFSDSVTKQLAEIEREQKAQKVAVPLNYGQLVRPSETPTKTWNGIVTNHFNVDEGVNARWIATFTRDDGVNLPPLVKFPYDYTLGRGTYEDSIAYGSIISVSGRDKRAIDEYNFYDALYEVGSNYIKWKIEIGHQWYYQATDGTTVSLTVQAVSMVSGDLTLERVI